MTDFKTSDYPAMVEEMADQCPTLERTLYRCCCWSMPCVSAFPARMQWTSKTAAMLLE